MSDGHKWGRDVDGEWVTYVTTRGNIARRPQLWRNPAWRPESVPLIETKPKDVMELWLRQGGYCGLCWQALMWSSLGRDGHPDEPTIDHIVPRSHGGGDMLMNTQAAHRGCNSEKGNRLDYISWLDDEFPGRQDVPFPRTAFDAETMSAVRREWLWARRDKRGDER